MFIPTHHADDRGQAEAKQSAYWCGVMKKRAQSKWQSANTASKSSKRQRKQPAATAAQDTTASSNTAAPSSTQPATVPLYTPPPAPSFTHPPVSPRQTQTPSSSSSAFSSLSPSPSSGGWSNLPLALFDRICSFLDSPVYDTLLQLSAVSEQWRHLVLGDARGRSDCWRYVPRLTLSPKDACMMVDPGQRRVDIPQWCPALQSLRRVRALHLDLFYGADITIDNCIRLLDLLFPEVVSSSISDPSSFALLDHLTCTNWAW